LVGGNQATIAGAPLESVRDRGPRYVAPVLDPTWENPYVPSAAEKHANHKVVRSFALRKKLPQTILIAVVSLALIAGVVAVPWLPVVGVAIALLYAWDLRRALVRYEEKGLLLGNLVFDQFKAGGTATDRLRLTTVLDRLTATFGVDVVQSYIVSDSGYNAALVPTARDSPSSSPTPRCAISNSSNSKASSRTVWPTPPRSVASRKRRVRRDHQ